MKKLRSLPSSGRTADDWQNGSLLLPSILPPSGFPTLFFSLHRAGEGVATSFVSLNSKTALAQ